MRGEREYTPRHKKMDHNAITELSKEQRETLRLLATGLNEKEVAEAQWITYGGFNYRMRVILEKLNCRNRGEAIICAYEAGLVVPAYAQKSWELRDIHVFQREEPQEKPDSGHIPTGNTEIPADTQ